MLNCRTRLHIFDTGRRIKRKRIGPTLNVLYIAIEMRSLKFIRGLSWDAAGPDILFMDNACPHRYNSHSIINNFLVEKDLPRMNWSKKSSDLNPIEQCSATFLSLRTGQRMIILPWPAEGGYVDCLYFRLF
ncbi:hypothetical protein TNCV_3401291 [Trichonephila clavipes]|nr:hypothetical protein TNCV_3401291 [Trichonephila clavipes]